MLELLAEDQQEVRAYSKLSKAHTDATTISDARWRLLHHSQERAKRMLEILETISAPTIENVGADGSQAISVIALHSRLSVMKEVLSSFEKSHRRDHDSVYYEAIPSLIDRISIFERRRQKFGTQWMLGADGRFFLPPVETFERMNERRVAHGLGKSKRPVDLTYGGPRRGSSRPETRSSDQRPLTNDEYGDYVYGRLD